uniref:Uncharacterized protein n=1 Tax=Anguilla anguilla TaxID=7936 RepID=A0A0E9UMP5_ANGAN
MQIRGLLTAAAEYKYCRSQHKAM